MNIPRYIDSQEEEDIQDIEAHLKDVIPQRDIEALQKYWAICPSLEVLSVFTHPQGLCEFIYPSK